jgi:hypothetical protein
MNNCFMKVCVSLVLSFILMKVNGEEKKVDKIAFNSDTVYKISPIGKVNNVKGNPIQLEIYDKYIPALQKQCNDFSFH